MMTSTTASTDLEIQIADFFVKNDFQCKKIGFCKSLGFLIFRLGGVPIFKSVHEISKYRKRVVIVEKNQPVLNEQQQLTSHPSSVFVFSFQNMQHLKAKMSDNKSVYIVYAHDGFFDELKNSRIRMIRIDILQ